MLAAASLGTAAVLAAGGYAYAAMWPTSQIFGRVVLAGHDPRELALTYDDGPNDRCTPALLDVLAEQQVRASFFVIGNFVRQQPALVRAIRDAGHVVGNHTVNHPVLLFASPRKVHEELAGCNARVEDVLGERVRYFRPPHGARRPDVLRAARELGLTPVLWNASSADWKADSAHEILSNLAKAIAGNQQRGYGSNLLMHDGGHRSMGQDRTDTVEATLKLIERYRSRAARFVTVEAWG